MPTNHPARSALLDILRRHIAGIESVQDTDGMWHQVLDHPEVWKEVSSTAMFSYSIARAVNRGWIDPANMAAARKGFAGLCQYITTNGVVNQVCPGTSLSTSFSYYVNTQHPANNDVHGPGPVLLAGAEILLHPQTEITATNGQVMVSWNAGLTNFLLETSADFIDWSVSNATYSLNSFWQNVATDSLDQISNKFYRLHFPPPSISLPLSYEAESLSYIASGATASLSADTNASGGSLVTLNSTGTGSYIEFTIPSVPAGSYRLLLAFKANGDHGQMNLTLDGNSFGTTLDQYWPTNFYPLVDFGIANFVATGDHAVRLTVTGKSDASTNYKLTADKFILLPP